jgi:phosphoglycerol transferase MdoB-like AlkP superfamily enzyme
VTTVTPGLELGCRSPVPGQRGALGRAWAAWTASDLLAPAAFLAAAFLKLSIFNLPPSTRLPSDWYGWNAADAGRAVLGSLGTLLIVASPLLLLRRRARAAAFWLLDAAVTLVVLVDLLHFRYFGDVVSVSALNAWSQIPLVRESILDILAPTDALLFADLLLVPGLLRAGRASPAAGPRARSARRPVAGAVVLAVGLALTLIPVTVVAADPYGALGWFRYHGVRRVGLLNYHVFEGGWEFFHDIRGTRAVGGEDRRRVSAFLEDWRRTAFAPSPLLGAARGSNVIILMVESLHAFPIGLRIEGAEVTPHLNALARRSMTFDRFYSQAWDGHSSDGEFTSLQSLHPLRAGSVPLKYPRHVYRGLPRILRERGYATLSAHAYYGDLWKMREMHPRLGFGTSLFRESYAQTETVGMGLSDAEFLRQTLPRIAALDRPFLAFLMTLSTHHPYEIPPALVRLRLPYFLDDTVLGRYLQAVHYVDAAIGDFVADLDAEGLLDDSILVVYGDHEAHLGLGDDYFLSRVLETYAGAPESSGEFDPALWVARTTLPLIIHLPDDRAAGTRSTSAGQLDVAPTLLTLLGIQDHEMVALGRDLSAGKNSLVVFRDGSFVEGRAYCGPTDSDASLRCWDTETGAGLETGPFLPRLQEARRHLEVSDLILAGDLIPSR